MSAKARWIALSLTVAVLGAGGAYYSYTQAGETSPSALSAAAKALEVRCDEASLNSCLEKTPPQATTQLNPWADEADPTVQQFVDKYWGASPASEQNATAELKGDGVQAITHESFQSLPAEGPEGDIVVLRFASVQGARATALSFDGTALDDTFAHGNQTQVAGLPGDVYTGLEPSPQGYLTSQYATSVGNLTMIVDFASYNTFDEKDFAAWAGGEYLSLSTARIPSAPVSMVQSATTSCGLLSCLMPTPADALPSASDEGMDPQPTVSGFVSELYPAAQGQSVADSLTTEGLTGIAQTAWAVNQGNHLGAIEGYVFLLGFATPQGAQSRAEAETSGFDEPVEFSVPGPGSARGESATSPDSAGEYLTKVSGYVGDVAVEVQVTDSLGSDRTDAVAWASQQLGILAAATTTSKAPAAPLAVNPTPPSEAGVTSSCSGALDCLMPLPGGATPWSSPAFMTSTSLANSQFVAGFYQNDSSAQLTAESRILSIDGLDSVAHRDWTAQDGDEADVFVLEFATAAGAQANAMGYQGATLSTGRGFAVPGDSSSVGVVRPGIDDKGNVATEVIGYQGRYEVRMVYFSPGAFSAPDAIDWFSLQKALLPAG